MEIPEIIRMMTTDKFTFDKAVLGKVISVSGSTCNVLAVERDVELIDVRLQTEASNGVLLTPAVDSFVICAPINDVEFVVVMYSAIDSIKLLDGSFGGLIKIEDLVEKVNNLESNVNDILNALNGITITLAPSGAVPFAPFFAAIAALTPTQVSDIENDKIQHGTT
jgi:hypothetical protein